MRHKWASSSKSDCDKCSVCECLRYNTPFLVRGRSRGVSRRYVDKDGKESNYAPVCDDSVAESLAEVGLCPKCPIDRHCGCPDCAC